MRDTYEEQSESLKRAILRAMYALDDYRSVEFMEGVSMTTPSNQTKRLALRCLWGSGVAGREAFERVRSQEKDDTQTEMYEQIEVEAEELPELGTGMRAHDEQVARSA